MKKEQVNKMEYAITFKKKNTRIHKGLMLNHQNKELEKEKDSYESPSKNKLNFGSEDGKSQTNKSTKEKKSLPSLIPPSANAMNPIRKMVAQRALADYMKVLSAGNNYQDKQSLHHETIILKQKNNELTAQNMKLKTKIMNLDTENIRMQRMLEQDIDARYPGTKESRVKSNQQSLISTKLMLRQTRKQLNILRQQNIKVKKTVKFTRISELETEKKVLQQQTVRLKELLEEQVAQNLNYKIKSNNKSQLQQDCVRLQQANALLKKQLQECSKKLKTDEEKFKSKGDPDKNLLRVINDLRRAVKEKTVEIQNLKKAKEETKQQRGVRSASLNKGKIVRMKCEECNSHKNQISKLKDKIQEMQKQIKQIKESAPVFQDIMIKQPAPAELDEVSTFLRYRFKAHHLSFENLSKYLIKVQSPTVSVGAMVESLLVQPFFLIHPLYLETMIAYLFYADSSEPEIKANQDFEKDVSVIKELFNTLIKPYDLVQPKKQQEIFIQIATIITQHCDHISAAFDSKRNGQGTISKNALHEFLSYIELNQQFIQFIITQIVLQSSDLQHLNYYSLFQIFYLPNSNFGNNLPEAVKELDEEYEQSQQSGRIRGVEKHDTLNNAEEDEYEEIFEEKDDEQEKQEDDIPEDNDGEEG